MIQEKEFSENYLNKGLHLPLRGKGKDISNVFNGSILKYWIDSGQAAISELSEEQKYYAGVKTVTP